jgi:hypothetical protein
MLFMLQDRACDARVCALPRVTSSYYVCLYNESECPDLSARHERTSKYNKQFYTRHAVMRHKERKI